MANWYVYASRAYGAYRLPLCGPFRYSRAAQAMRQPVERVIRRDRPDLNDTDVLVGLLNTKRPGLLPQAVDEEWIRWCVTYSSR